MNLERIRNFIVVAEELNFTKAAEKLFITQPSLSRQISSLEKDLGYDLFERGKHIKLTPEGMIFLKECYKITEHFDSFVAKAHQIKNEEPRQITIGFHGSSEYDLTNMVVQRINNHLQNIDFQFVSDIFSILYILLHDNAIDFALVPMNCIPSDSGIDTIKIAKNEFGMVLPKTHPLANRSTIQMEELRNENLVLCNQDFTLTQNRLINELRKKHIFPKVACYENDLYMRLLYILIGKGIGMMASIFAEQFSQDFVFIPVDGFQDNADIVLAWKRDNNNPLIPEIISVLKQEKIGEESR